MKNRASHQDGGSNPWRIFLRGNIPAHRTGALTPTQGTFAFSWPGCQVLSADRTIPDAAPTQHPIPLKVKAAFVS